MSNENVSKENKRDVRIAISGKSGCGNTTISRLVADALEFRVVNFTFRNLAQEKGMELAELLEKAAKDAEKPGAQGGGSASQAASSKKGSGEFLWPAPGYSRISSSFGNRMHPIKKKVLQHTGIDIAAPSGASVVAAKGGTVIIAEVQGGYGKTVVISHGNGLTTLYGHCSKLLVESGQTVKAGAVIAKVGSTGVSTGPHLHFEVRKNGSPVQPLNYL